MDVIVKYLDGAMIKGVTENFVVGRIFKFTSEDGELLNIPFRLLKAVFFTKDENIKGKVQPRFGKKILVEFSDGEKILGTTVDFKDDKPVFTIYPIDKESNNDRIIVNVNAAVKINILGTTLGVENKPLFDNSRPLSKKMVEGAVYKVIYKLAIEFQNPKNTIDEAFLLDKKIFIKNRLESLIRQFEGAKTREECVEIIGLKMKEVEMDLGNKGLDKIDELMKTLFEDTGYSS